MVRAQDSSDLGEGREHGPIPGMRNMRRERGPVLCDRCFRRKPVAAGAPVFQGKLAAAGKADNLQPPPGYGARGNELRSILKLREQQPWFCRSQTPAGSTTDGGTTRAIRVYD